MCGWVGGLVLMCVESVVWKGDGGALSEVEEDEKGVNLWLHWVVNVPITRKGV